MPNPHAPSPAAQNDPVAAWRAAGRRWSLAGGSPVRIADFDDGAPYRGAPDIVLVPSEDVLLLAVPLPPMASTLRRRAALPFAIEEQIAEPLDRVHIALGSELAPGVWLAGVVRHAVMAGWLERVAEAALAENGLAENGLAENGLAENGLERAWLVPDALMLPVPISGCWSVDLTGGRALVRADDGSGFAVPLALLDAAWRAAGEPACIAYGDPLPAPFAAAPAGLAAPVALAPPVDLRQGIYAARRRPFNPLWRQIAVVAGLGALAHGAIAIADTIAVAHLAQQRSAKLRALGASLQPPVEIAPDLGDAIIALTPDAAATGSSRFMALLTRSAAALNGGSATANPASAPIWRSVTFDGAAGTLTIELEVGDIADLQRMAQALTAAGLSAQPGSATSQGGKAIGSFVVRAP